jgi:hypothetical protein
MCYLVVGTKGRGGEESKGRGGEESVEKAPTYDLTFCPPALPFLNIFYQSFPTFYT